MKKALIIILPLVFTAQACNFLFGDLTGQEGSGNRGIFISTDSGQTWQESSKISREKSLASAQITQIYIEEKESKNLLVTTSNAGIYGSESRGEKWFSLLPDVVAYSVFINPQKSEEIFVGGSRNRLAVILKSPDRAGSWVQIYNEPAGLAAVTALIYDPNNASVLYAGLSTGTILQSLDRGENWNVLADFEDRVVRLIFLPHGKTLYVLGRAEGLKRSQDSGKTWQDLALAQTASQYNDLVADPKNSSILYLGTEIGLFQSLDAGANWKKLLLPATPEVVNVSALAVNPDNSRQIFAAVRSTVYRSDDQGKTWRTANLPTNRIINEIAIDAREPNRIYVGLK